MRRGDDRSGVGRTTGRRGMTARRGVGDWRGDDRRSVMLGGR